MKTTHLKCDKCNKWYNQTVEKICLKCPKEKEEEQKESNIPIQPTFCEVYLQQETSNHEPIISPKASDESIKEGLET